MSTHRITIKLNGRERRATVEANRLLIQLLRDDLGLTGTKEGCSVGVCGACTVLVDREPMSACLLLAVLADGAEITTVEGLVSGDALSPLQESFIRNGGFQCGICTPGQLVAASALLNVRPQPTQDEIRHWMMGNLCRCTGYYGVIKSVEGVGARRSATEARERDPGTGTDGRV